MKQVLGNESECRLISVVARAARIAAGGRLSELGIGMGEFPLLCSLLQADGCSQDDLASRVFLDKGATARVLARLEKNGFVRREAVPGNRRMNRVFATDKAREVEEGVMNVLRGLNAEIMGGLTREERRLFHGMLRVVEQNARNLPEYKNQG